MRFLIFKNKQYTALDVLEALKAEDFDLVNKASIGRIFQHTNHKNGFAIVTHAHNDFTKENGGVDHRGRDHAERRKQFEAYLKKHNYGHIPMVGHGQEADASGHVSPSKEQSYFIPKMKYHHVAHLAREFGQTAFVHHNGKNISLHEKNKKSGEYEPTDLGKFHPKKLGEYYSSIKKNKHFTFKAISYVNSNTWAEGLGLSLRREKGEI
jgi:hypothetical protein